MPHMFLPTDGLKAIYKFLSPHELISIGSSASPLVRKLAITALFEQHTQEAMHFQQRLLHYWAQYSSPYMPDEKTMLKALAFYPPEKLLVGLFIYAQRKLTFSETEFQTRLQAIDTLESQKGLISVSSLTQNAMMLTNRQRATLLEELKKKYTPNTPAMLSKLAPYMIEDELKATIEFLIKKISNEHVDPPIQAIPVLGSYLKQTIPSLSFIVANIILPRNSSWVHSVSQLCSIIPMALSEDCLLILNYLKMPPRNQFGHYREYGTYPDFLSHSRPLVQKLIPYLSTELLEEYLSPLISSALETGDEEILLFLTAILQHMNASQLKPVLEQLLPYLQLLIPPYTHNAVTLSNLLFKPLGLAHLNPLRLFIQSNPHEYQCNVALQLLQTAASKANPEQLTAAFELLHQGLNYLNDNIHHKILKTFPALIMRLGTRTLTVPELNSILDVTFLACRWEEENIKPLNELLSCLSSPMRVLGITYLLKNHIVNSISELRFSTNRKTLTSIAEHATSAHQMLIWQLFSQSQEPKMHLDLMRLLSPFHTIFSSQQITQLLTIALINLSHTDYDHKEAALETLQAIHYKTNAKQKTEIHLALRQNWDGLPFMSKRQILLRLYPSLSEAERCISLDHIFSTTRYLEELLTFIHQIHRSIPTEKIFYVLSQILKRIKSENDPFRELHFAKEVHLLIQELFSALAPQIEKEQRTLIMSTILKHCEKAQQPKNFEEDAQKHHNKRKASNNIAFLACEMIPSLTCSLNSKERLALFEKLNTSLFQKFLSSILLFPNFLNLSHPKNADLEPLQSLEEEHRCYIYYLISFINTPQQTSSFHEILYYRATPTHALTALNFWMLQCLQEQPESLLFVHQVIHEASKEENTKEFHMLQQLINLYCIKESPSREAQQARNVILT